MWAKTIILITTGALSLFWVQEGDRFWDFKNGRGLLSKTNYHHSSKVASLNPSDPASLSWPGQEVGQNSARVPASQFRFEVGANSAKVPTPESQDGSGLTTGRSDSPAVVSPGGEAFAAETPAEAPETPSEVPPQPPAIVPAEDPAKGPAETPAEVPPEAPANIPAEAPAKGPAEALAEAPANTPAEAPAKEPAEAPEEPPAKGPAEAPAEAPVKPAQVPLPLSTSTELGKLPSSNSTNSSSPTKHKRKGGYSNYIENHGARVIKTWPSNPSLEFPVISARGRPPDFPLSVRNRELVGLDEPEARIKGEIVIATVLPSPSLEAHQMLRGILEFQENTTVFISCSEATMQVVTKFFPTLRFVFHPWLDQPDGNLFCQKWELQHLPSIEKEKLCVMRIAMESGAKAVWYLGPRTVLVSSLPTMDPSTEIGFPPLQTSATKQQVSIEGLLYISSAKTIADWGEATRTVQGEHQEQTALGSFRGRPGSQELECGAHVAASELDEGQASSPTSKLECSEGKLKFGECWVRSLQHPERAQSGRILPTLRSILAACGHPAVQFFDGSLAVPRNEYRKTDLLRNNSFFDKNLNSTNETREAWLGAGNCLRKWCHADDKLVSSVVLYQGMGYATDHPVANVVGQRAIVIVVTFLGYEVHRLLSSIKRFEANTIIFVSCSRMVAQELPVQYPNLRFSLHARLDKYRHTPGGAWQTRKNMAHSGLWFKFNAEKAYILRIALQSGARCAWYLDTDVHLMSPLPEIDPKAKVGLARHHIFPKREGQVGKYNSGVVYFSSNEHIDLWLNAKQPNRPDIAQIALVHYDSDPDMYELPVGENVGWYQLQSGNVPDGQGGGNLTCDGPGAPIKWLGEPASTFHYKTDGDFGLGGTLKLRAGKCLHPGLAPLNSLQHPETKVQELNEFTSFRPSSIKLWGTPLENLEPGANVLRQSTICILVKSGLSEEAYPLLESIQTFEAATTIFVGLGSNDRPPLDKLFPGLRFTFYGKDTLRLKEKGELKFELEKAFLMRMALIAGADNVWFLDLRSVLQGKLPQLPRSLKVGMLQEGSSHSAIYTSDVVLINDWIRALRSAGQSAKDSGPAALIEQHRRQNLTAAVPPDAIKMLHCGAGVGAAADVSYPVSGGGCP